MATEIWVNIGLCNGHYLSHREVLWNSTEGDWQRLPILQCGIMSFKIIFLPEASLGLRVLSLPASLCVFFVCVCVCLCLSVSLAVSLSVSLSVYVIALKPTVCQTSSGICCIEGPSVISIQSTEMWLAASGAQPLFTSWLPMFVLFIGYLLSLISKINRPWSKSN